MRSSVKMSFSPFVVLEKSMKLKIFLGSLIIGAVATVAPAYSAGFTAASIGEWFFNTLFATAILGFLGTRFLLKDEDSTPRRRRKK